jgi:hypothetical protein
LMTQGRVDMSAAVLTSDSISDLISCTSAFKDN